MADVSEIDALTGTITERDFTEDEHTQRQADLAAWAARAEAEAQVAANRGTLEDRARKALSGNRDFLALAAPTNAQTLAHVKGLTRQNTALIRLVLNILDATD